MQSDITKLQSHGVGSSLIEHTQQVADCATTPEERLFANCHDAIKATVEFQEYSNGGFRHDSPHRHAAGGAWLALIALEVKLGTITFEQIVHAQVNAGHHSELSQLGQIESENGPHELAIYKTNEEFQAVVDFLNVVEPGRDWAQILAKARERTSLWSQVDGPTPPPEVPSEEQLIELYLQARNFLGRLVQADHLSAMFQTHRAEMAQCGIQWEAPPKSPSPVEFKLRKRRREVLATNPPGLNGVRNQLLKDCLTLAAGPSRFLIINSPTGTAKTEGMLQAAEYRVQTGRHDRIVFGLPLISVMDQLLRDYLQNEDVTIWNNLVKGRPQQKGAKSETAEAHVDAIITEPFKTSYTVTTFHQILKAVLHPGGRACKEGLNLRNAVVILDEIHKLPLIYVRVIMPILAAYSRKNNLTIIFGSATNFPWDLIPEINAEARCLPTTYTEFVSKTPEVKNRRCYQKHRRPKMTATELGEEMKLFHQAHPQTSLCVILNAISQGTIPTWQTLTGTPRDIRKYHTIQLNRSLYILDGLTPPFLRRVILSSVRKKLRNGDPVTLLTTSAIEVGTDLDFGRLWDDFNTLDSSLQRAGRCGREYKLGREPIVELFELLVEEKDNLCSSRDLQHRMQLKTAEALRQGNVFPQIEEVIAVLKSFHKQQQQAWDKIVGVNPEENIVALYDKHITSVLQELKTTPIAFADIFKPSFNNKNLGSPWEKAAFIYDLFATTSTPYEAIILKRLKEKPKYDQLLENDQLPFGQILQQIRVSEPNLKASQIQAAAWAHKRAARRKLKEFVALRRIQTYGETTLEAATCGLQKLPSRGDTPLFLLRPEPRYDRISD